MYPQMAKALARARLGSLRFDFSGNGESEGAFEFGNYWAEVRGLVVCSCVAPGQAGGAGGRAQAVRRVGQGHGARPMWPSRSMRAEAARRLQTRAKSSCVAPCMSSLCCLVPLRSGTSGRRCSTCVRWCAKRWWPSWVSGPLDAHAVTMHELTSGRGLAALSARSASLHARRGQQASHTVTVWQLAIAAAVRVDAQTYRLRVCVRRCRALQGRQRGAAVRVPVRRRAHRGQHRRAL